MRRFKLAIVLAAALFLALSIQSQEGRFSFSASRPLKIWVFDIGQGDAILLEAPDGEQLMIDAGPGQNVLPKLGSVLWPWDRTLDAILLTHPHEDHLAGFLKILEQYEVHDIYETGSRTSGPSQKPFSRLVSEEEGAVHHLVQDGQKFSLGEVQIEVIASDRELNGVSLDDPNMGSIVLIVTYGQTSILLTGDAPTDEENEILPDLTEAVDVLKVAHHGSGYSTSRQFLEIARPRYAIISAGAGNTYGHPHPVLLERLKDFGVQTFRTDLDGDILITSTGGEPTVSAVPLPF